MRSIPILLGGFGRSAVEWRIAAKRDNTLLRWRVFAARNDLFAPLLVSGCAQYSRRR